MPSYSACLNIVLSQYSVYTRGMSELFILFSVGVPEITEDQFFEEFSCISQIQTKKRGQINKEVYSRKRSLNFPGASTAEITGLKPANVEVEKDKLFKQLVKIAIHRSCKYDGLENEEVYSKQIFKKTDEDYFLFAEQVKSENKIKRVVDISIIEARHLVAKDIEGTSDPYATVHIMSKNEKQKESETTNFRVTKVDYANLNPKWDEVFTINLSDHKDQELVVMLWDYDEDQSAKAAVRELSKIKSVGGLGRYITNIAQTVNNKNAHDFLGMVTVPVKSIPQNGLDEWFTLQQRTSKSKVSGEMHLKLFVNSIDAGCQGERSKLFTLHKQLYTFLLSHEGKRQHPESMALWGFRLPRESEIIIEMHQNFTGLSSEHTVIAKWEAQSTHYMEAGGSEEVLVDTLAELTECPDSILTEEETEELLLTLNWFGNYVRYLLSELPFTCSPHKKTDLKTVTDLLRGYVMLFKIDVWNPLQVTTESDISKLLQTAASDLFEKVKTADKTGNQDMKSQLESLIRTVIRLHCEIESFSSDYQVIFKPCNFDVQLVVYDTVVALLIEDVRKVMVGVNKYWSKVLPDANSVLISAFVLYNSINQLVQASDPTNDKASRLQHIFKSFFAELLKKWCLMNQTKLASHSEKLIIMEKIQSESTVEESSVSTREIVRAVKNICKCWLDINTPICSDNAPIFINLVSTLCAHLQNFTLQLKSLVVEMRYHSSYDTQFDIQDEMLVAFNNMYLLRQVNLGLDEELNMKLWTSSYEKLLEIIQTNDTALKEEENILTVGLVEKMDASIEKYVFELKKANPDVSASQVLGTLLDYLDSNITVISRMQDKGSLSNIVGNVWGKICTKLKDVVETKPQLEEQQYFRVGDSVKFLKNHFQNNLGENGIPAEKLASQPEFVAVMATIDLQKMETTDLIVRHYKEQSEERGERSTGAGVIDLKLSLKERRDGKAILHVKLLGARKLIGLDNNGKSDPFITLQVVPHHLFPDCELKQSTVKKGTLEPMYNEMFEFIIPQDQINNGVLVLTVFDYDFISSNDFEGEAMVRLSALPRNCEQHVKWTMALHRPKQDSIYKILAARLNDRLAMKFKDIRMKAMEAEELENGVEGVTNSDASKASRSKNSSEA